MLIAVDAMGGDRAPVAAVDGAVRAAREHAVDVSLVGPADAIERELSRHEPVPSGIRIVDAPEAVEMHEPPLAALRRKPRASVRVAADLVASGQAAAFFSAGHSGATCLAARSTFGLLSGVERPALAVIVPTLSGLAVLLDAGANADCRPSHLAQFADLGAAYARVALTLPGRPRVGLLSIGEEAGKGNDLIREAHRLLRDTPGYIGNIDARDMFTGRADVIVCDGFTGNVALKVGEGVAEAIERMLRDELDAAIVSQIGALLTRRAFARFRQRIDAEEYGAAPLLGLQGLALVGHGRSSARAVASGIGMASRLSQAGVLQQLAAVLARS